MITQAIWETFNSHVFPEQMDVFNEAYQNYSLLGLHDIDDIFKVRSSKRQGYREHFLKIHFSSGGIPFDDSPSKAIIVLNLTLAPMHFSTIQQIVIC